MKTKSKAKEIIRILENGGFYAECPCCNEPVLLKSCGLFYLDEFTQEARELYEQAQEDLKKKAVKLKDQRRAISRTSEIGAKAVNLGFILERLAPSLGAFRFERNDCRSLFDPIDYLIFEGLSTKGAVGRIFFVDIKTGGSRLQVNQKQIKALVESKKIAFLKYRSEELDDE